MNDDAIMHFFLPLLSSHRYNTKYYLIEIGKASDSILQECLFDIDSDTRAIARTALDGAQRLAEQPY